MKLESIKELIFKSLESWGLNRKDFTIGDSVGQLTLFSDSKIKKIIKNYNLTMFESSDYIVKYKGEKYLMEVDCGCDDNFIMLILHSPQTTKNMKNYFDDGYYKSIIEEKGYL